MSDKNINVSSKMVEQGLDIAKSFLDKLIFPTVEQVGLLMADPIKTFRIRNQIKMLNKTQAICERNGIDPKKISLKVLVPLLEGASLEEEDEMQDKWATLLSNLVDSEQNIENHVFPYILGQISLREFREMETNVNRRLKKSQEWLDLKEKLADQIDFISTFLKETTDQNEGELYLDSNEVYRWQITPALTHTPTIFPEDFELRIKISQARKKLKELRMNSLRLNYFFSEKLEEFEINNLFRLGLIKDHTEYESITQDKDSGDFNDFGRVNIPTLSELGAKFIITCTEKLDRITPDQSDEETTN